MCNNYGLESLGQWHHKNKFHEYFFELKRNYQKGFLNGNAENFTFRKGLFKKMNQGGRNLQTTPISMLVGLTRFKLD